MRRRRHGQRAVHVQGHGLRRIGRLAMAAISGCALFTSTGRGADTADQVKQMLELGWKASLNTDSMIARSANFKKVQAQYQQAKQVAPTDDRIDYAMALVAAQNNRPSAEVIKYLDSAPTAREPPLYVHRIKAWTVLNGSDTTASITAITDLAHAVKASDSPSSAADSQDTARWIGRVIGYFSGPGKNRLKPEELAALDAEISKSLTGSMAAACSEGQVAVSERYTELKDQLDAAQKTLKEKGDRDRKAQQAQNDAALTQNSADLTNGNLVRDKALQDYQVKQKAAADNRRLKAIGQNLWLQSQGLGATLNDLEDQLKREQQKPSKDQDEKLIKSLNSRIDNEAKRVNARKTTLRNTNNANS